MIIRKSNASFCVNKQQDCFEYLRRYIGKKLRIRKKKDDFRICTKYGTAVLLTSDKSVERAVHLKRKDCNTRVVNHIGHDLICVGYGCDVIQNVAIECEDCCEIIYSIDAVKK